MVIWGDVFFDRKKKNIMKLRTGWLALAFFVTVSAVGVGTWYHQSHKNNLAPSTPVQKVEQQAENGFDVKGRIKVSLEK
jgi:hypothetical protein